MDEVVARKLLRQVRLLNVLIITSTLLFIGMFAASGFFGYIAFKEVRNAQKSVTSLQSTGTSGTTNTDALKQQLCSSDDSSLSSVLKQSDICN